MVARSGLKISDRGQASLGTWTGSKPCTNIRRREDLRKGQTLEWSREGKGSAKLLKECVGVCKWTCMDSRRSLCLLGMAVRLECRVWAGTWRRGSGIQAAWGLLFEAIAIACRARLRPIWEPSGGTRGRLACQVKGHLEPWDQGSLSVWEISSSSKQAV